MKTPTLHAPRVLLLGVLLLCLTVAGQVTAGKVKDEPGYIDLEWIEIPDSASEVQDIDLSDILKSVAADSKGSGDEDLAKVLEMVRSIRVKGFSVGEKDDKAIGKAVDRITADLKDKGWKRLIYLKDGDEVMSVSTRYQDEDLVGLMVVAYEPGEEALFVNVVGDLDLPTLMKLVGGMNGEGLEEMLENLEGVHDIEIEKNDN
jgi:hypothetical protein